MDDETVLVDPETTLKEPKRRGRPRKILDAFSSDAVEDNVNLEQPVKKERKPRSRKRTSHVDEIESLLSGCFQLAAIRMGPVMLVPSPLGDEDTQKQEKEALHTTALYFDKWQMGLSDDSPFVKLVNSAVEISPLLIAFGGLGRIAFIKYSMMQDMQKWLEEQAKAQNGHGV